ncbi:restriction endonuclease [Sphingopyxis sp. GC21]|uniref:restriction endonuclease n=1 Tax=Sphingopyxis sp. GC21 TaxID=2933562 RepID=UPI0021E42CAE|nr:restriction endonuclease [Sphingopyxis sp. GC21]
MNLPAAPTLTDQQLLGIVQKLQLAIEQWAKQHDLWYDCGFKSYADHVDGEPLAPVATIMHFEGPFGNMLDGYYDDLESDFRELLEQQGFWYERENGVSIHIYPLDESPLFTSFTDFVRWQWICGLLQPDVADVFEEIYAHFANRPDDLHRLHWREFEILLYRIFQNQGFQAQLGPGSGDGGIDIRLLQRDPLGDMMTLVQAKKYAPNRKIGLEAVAALHGIAGVEGAQQSLFVTTSSYLPVANRFAGRTSGQLSLATSTDVTSWCEQATQGIIQDKSTLISLDHLSKLVRGLGPRDPRIVHAHTGVTMILNEFAIVLKETKYAALLMTLPSKSVADDGYGQTGFEIPLLDQSSLGMLKADTVFRTKRSVDNGRVSYWSGQHLYTPWNGEPQHFSFLD